MALEGNLNDFGLSEILQLIAVQKKSGMLSVTSKGESMVLFFRNGNIISTRDRRRKAHDPLKDYLIRYGVISREDFLRITQLSAQSNLDLTDIIVSEGFLTEEEMKRHYRNQIQEALHEVLTWQQCSYKFIPNPDVIRGIKIWGEYGIEGLLMESMRRIDEFPQMLEEFPDPDMVIKRKVAEPDTEDWDRNEKAVFELLADAPTLGYVVSHAKMPAFETYEALKHLKERGVIETSAPAPGRGKVEDIAEAMETGRGSRHLVPTVVSAVLFAVASIIGIKGFAGHLSPSSAGLRQGTFTSLLARRQVQEKVRYHLEAYRALYGSYPGSLKKLEESGLIDGKLAQQIESLSFRYHLTPSGRGYTLF